MLNGPAAGIESLLCRHHQSFSHEFSHITVVIATYFSQYLNKFLQGCRGDCLYTLLIRPVFAHCIQYIPWVFYFIFYFFLKEEKK